MGTCRNQNAGAPALWRRSSTDSAESGCEGSGDPAHLGSRSSSSSLQTFRSMRPSEYQTIARMSSQTGRPAAPNTRPVRIASMVLEYRRVDRASIPAAVACKWAGTFGQVTLLRAGHAVPSGGALHGFMRWPGLWGLVWGLPTNFSIVSSGRGRSPEREIPWRTSD